MTDEISVLVASIKSKAPAERQGAAERLVLLGRDARPAAVALVQACQSEDEGTRELAAAALEDLGPPLAEDVAQLAALLKRPSLDIAYWSATLLGRLQAQAAPAVSNLNDALATHPELAVRQRAAWALGEIGSAAGPAREALQHAAAGADRRLAALAATALQNLAT